MQLHSQLNLQMQPALVNKVYPGHRPLLNGRTPATNELAQLRAMPAAVTNKQNASALQ
jgi:hypothetical protein